MKIATIGVSSMLLAMVMTAPAVHAADPAPAVSEPDAALVDAIIRKMESSGALDAAVDRAITRYVQRKEQARQEAGRAKSARDV